MLSAELTALSHKVQELLSAIDISHHPVMFRDALALRRQLGSESVFAACVIDWISESVYLCWLGDCRIRLYNRAHEPMVFDQKLFRTSERWSSQRTLVVDLHSIRLPLHTVQRIVLYSDGLQILDNTSLETPQLQHIVSDAVSKSLQLPESDDITLIAYDTVKVI